MAGFNPMALRAKNFKRLRDTFSEWCSIHISQYGDNREIMLMFNDERKKGYPPTKIDFIRDYATKEYPNAELFKILRLSDMVDGKKVTWHIIFREYGKKNMTDVEFNKIKNENA